MTQPQANPTLRNRAFFFLLVVISLTILNPEQAKEFAQNPEFQSALEIVGFAVGAYLLKAVGHLVVELKDRVSARIGADRTKYLTNIALDFVRAAEQTGYANGWTNPRKKEWTVDQMYAFLQKTPMSYLTREEIGIFVESAVFAFKQDF